jgi:hypothetical protein
LAKKKILVRYADFSIRTQFILLSCLTNFKEENKWESSSSSSGRKCITVFRSALHYFLILTQICPVHEFTPYCFKISFNITLATTPFSTSWSLPFRFWTEIVYALHVIPPVSNRAVCSNVGSLSPGIAGRHDRSSAKLINYWAFLYCNYYRLTSIIILNYE